MKSIVYQPSLGAFLTISLISANVAQPAQAVDLIKPDIDDAMPLISQTSGQQCTTFADVGLAHRGSATLELTSNGFPTTAYLIWSGRDRDNLGDNDIVIDGQTIVADIENHGESGGGSWWHTYASDVTPLVEAQAHTTDQLQFTVSGLSIGQNRNGEDHGVGLVVISNSSECSESETNFHFGLDSFKQSAPEPLYGPHSAVQCTTVAASPTQRQVDLSLHIGGIENAERNATIWLMSSDAEEVPDTLIGENEALSFVDPVGNLETDRQWDRFSTSIDIPPGHTKICTQIESTGEEGISAVLVSLLAQVRTVESSLPNSISGRVWIDANQDGIVDEDEAGASNVVVLLRDSGEGAVLQAFVTGSSGEYRFTGMPESTYIVDVADELFSEEWVQVSDPDSALDTETTITLTAGMAVGNVDFGFVTEPPTGTVAGAIWQDMDGNGLRDESTEPGIADVAVILLDVDQNLVAEQITTETGAFEFDDLALLDYKVQIRNESLSPTLLQTAESDGTLDGSVDVTFSDTVTRREIQFGYGTKGEISGRLWLDQNGDGLESAGEPAINNALLLLTNNIGVGRVAATQNGGNYTFVDLTPGLYELQIVEDTIPPELVPTFDVDGTLDGATSLEISVSTTLTGINFGYQSEANSRSISAPRIDISRADVDLADEQALLDYLQISLLTVQNAEPDIDEEAAEEEAAEEEAAGEEAAEEEAAEEEAIPPYNSGQPERPEVEAPAPQPPNVENEPDDPGLQNVIHLPLIY